MLRASLNGLLSYRGRLTATVLAIVLGVGFVTGTLVFTDALRTTFYDRFAQAERGVDAAVIARDDGRLDEMALDAARAVPGVAVADGVLFLADGRLAGELEKPTVSTVLDRLGGLEEGR